MVVISKTFSIPQFYDSHAIAPLKDLVFLDIETTGLTPATSSIYLIGAVYHQQMEWHIRQWFSDSLNSEQEILEDFFSFIKNYQVVVSFNGETFDIPFLKKCAAAYGLNTDALDNIRSFDLYRHLRPVKTLLQLENLKLATLESYLNISRLDQATGKEMIAVYHDYLETGDKRLYQVLLLHNEDDLKALPQIMPLLSYLDIFRSEWTLAGYSLSTASSSLTIVVDCSVKVPVAVT
ncbi:ribonuclease H-like domain-containing protein, partial [Anthropogastromicrobium sp.]